MRIKEKPNKLYDGEGFPDWQWEDNLKHWYCYFDDDTKVIVWCEWLNPPTEGKKKISKSDEDKRLLWDGICTTIPGGPEPSSRPGPILSWI